MNRQTVDYARKLIEDAIILHMPTTAAASGFCGLVDHSTWIANMSQRYPIDQRPENMGLTAFRAWLKDHGCEVGEGVAKELRKVWLKEMMVAEYNANPKGATFHADVR